MKYHYTYRITNIQLSKHYYGTRTSKVHPKLDLGIKYFSSSSDKDFINDQKLNPSNYKYKVIKISKTRKEAIELEIKLHLKFDVGLNENFYNRAKQTSTGFDTTGLHWKLSNETKNKMSKYASTNNNFKGKKHSKENIELFSKLRKGKPQQGGVKFHSEETKLKISQNHKNVSGENNPCFGLTDEHPNAKNIIIFNELHQIMFKTKGTFKSICSSNNLPFGPLTKSYQNQGTPIFQSKLAKTRAIKNNTECYIGWYAKIV